MKKVYVLLFAIFLLTSLASAETGEAGFKFLDIGVGPRAIALGNTFTAVPNDVTALYWNPAGIADIRYSEYQFTHINWLFDIKYEQLYGAMNVGKGKNRVIGIGLLYLYQEEFPIINDYLTTGETFKSDDLIINLGYAFQFTKNFAAGIGAKFIKDSLGDISSSGISFDLGAIYKMELFNFSYLPYNNFNIGLTVKDIAPSSRINSVTSSLPMKIKLGLLYIPWKYAQVLTDVGYNMDTGFQFNIGAEFLPAWYIQPRVGLNFENGKANFSTGVGAGYTIDVYRIGINYAIVPSTLIGTRHLFSLNLKKLSITDVGVLAKIKKDIQDKKIEIAKIEDDINKIENKGNELLDLIISGKADKRMVKDKIMELKEQKDKLLKDRNKLRKDVEKMEQEISASEGKVIIKERTVEKIVIKNRTVEIERKPGSILAFVLDFKNVSTNPDYNYLSQAVPDSISVHMAKSEKITLISRSMVESALEELEITKDNALQMENVKKIGKFLHSNAVVIGSFIIQDEILRLNAQVVDMKTGNVIVAEQSQGELGIDMFEVFDDLSLKIKNDIEKWYGKDEPKSEKKK